MPTSETEKVLLFLLRLLLAWTFLYAGWSQITTPGWSVAGFLSGTKTFHDVYAPLGASSWAPIITFLVEYGHLLIGLSLLLGLLVRVSAVFGTILVLVYWTAHMDFPYIENPTNFLVDFHIVYAVVLVLLINKRAGHIWGLDAWAEKLSFFDHHPRWRALVA